MTTMRSLAASELLGVWERGLDQSPIERAVELLSAAYPEVSRDSLLRLSIGQRDAELLALREQLFGPGMAAVTACPGCEGRLDLTLSTREMRSANSTEVEAEMALNFGGYKLFFRHPSSEDLAVAMEGSDIEGAQQLLLGRCLISTEKEGVPVPFDQLSPQVVEAVLERMAGSDPLADIQLVVSCPSCSHVWRAKFDIVSFLWREIENLVGRLLRDVHTLASTYGWHERDILALSPARRQFYLALQSR
jgi:hypothetical protein